MTDTLAGFDWNNKDDRTWLTEYFLGSTRKPKSNISIPNIKGIREEKSQELFELFFEDLQHGSEDDKRIRKNVMSAWRKKLKQLENHKQINIELTNDEYDKLIYLKNLKDKKATIKDTILDLIYNEYGEHQDIRQELEKVLRKEITQEMRKKTRSDMPKRSIKTPVEIESTSNNHQTEQIKNKVQVESQIIEKIEALNNDTNARFERLEFMLSEAMKYQTIKEEIVTQTVQPKVDDSLPLQEEVRKELKDKHAEQELIKDQEQQIIEEESLKSKVSAEKEETDEENVLPTGSQNLGLKYINSMTKVDSKAIIDHFNSLNHGITHTDSKATIDSLDSNPKYSHPYFNVRFDF